MLRFRTLLVLCCCAWASGCAVAGEVDPDVRPKIKVDASRDGLSIEEDADVDEDTGGSPSEDTGTDPPPDSGGDPPDGGGTTDTGGSSTPDTGGGSIDTGTVSKDTGGGTPCTTASAATCASSPVGLGSMAGDKGSPTKSATGTDGQFLRVNITEDDSGLLSPKDLRVTFTLTSPPGQNFDLYVYAGKAKDDGGGVECSSVSMSSTSAGVDVISMKWSDKQGLTGHDDAKQISIEVRPAAGTMCGSGTWSLLVEGNK